MGSVDSYAEWHERFLRSNRQRKVMICRHLLGGMMEIRLYREIGITIECVSMRIDTNGSITDQSVSHVTVDWATIFNSLGISQAVVTHEPLNFLIFAVEGSARNNPTEVEHGNPPSAVENPPEEVQNPPEEVQNPLVEPQDHLEEAQVNLQEALDQLEEAQDHLENDSQATYVDSDIFINFEDDAGNAEFQEVAVQTNKNKLCSEIMRWVIWSDPWGFIPCTLITVLVMILLILLMLFLCRLNFI